MDFLPDAVELLPSLKRGRPKETGMACVICENLERVYQVRLSEYLEARSSAGYRVSTRLAAQMNVEMERARYELEEHQAECVSAIPVQVLVPQRELPASLQPLAA
jgi:hypothetical protein